MKTKIGSTKKLIMAAVALVASLGVAAGSTFAWFTTSETVTMQQLSSQVVAGSNALTVAAVPLTTTAVTTDLVNSVQFKSTLTEADINRSLRTNPADTADTSTPFTSARMAAATTTDGLAFTGQPTFGQPTNTAGTSLNANSANGGYKSFMLVFRNRAGSGSGTNLYLGSTSNIIPKEVEENDIPTVPYNATQYPTIAGNISSDSDYYGAEITGDSITTRAAYAARATFTNVSTPSSTKIWAPNEKYTNGGNTEAGTVNADATGFSEHNLAKDFYNDSLGLSGDTAADDTQATLSTAVIASETLDTNNLVATFAAITEGDLYTYALVRVNIWLEGTDGDCFDVILEDTFITSLTFKVNTPAASA